MYTRGKLHNMKQVSNTPRTAAEDLGKSRQPAISPITKKVTPLLVKPFATAMKKTTPQSRKKLVDTYFGKMNIKSTSAKVKKEMREILVTALKKDVGWLEFVAGQLIEGCSKEISDLLANPKEARVAAIDIEKADRQDKLDDIAVDEAARDGWHSEGLDTIWYRNVNTGERLTEDEVIHMYLPKAKSASMKKFADTMDAVYEGRYPDIRFFEDFTYPMTLDVSGGQNDSLYRLQAVLRELGYDDDKNVEIGGAEELEDIFNTLSDESDTWAEESQESFSEYADEDSDEYDSGDQLADQHEPAALFLQKVLNTKNRSASVKLASKTTFRIMPTDLIPGTKTFQWIRAYDEYSNDYKTLEEADNMAMAYEAEDEFWDSVEYDPETNTAKKVLEGPLSASTKRTAYNIASLYEDRYPEMHDIEGLSLTYPYELEMPYSSGPSAAVRADADALGLMGDDTIVFESDDDVYDLFVKLEQRAANATEAWMADREDEDDMEGMSDAHEPGAFLAQELGFTFS